MCESECMCRYVCVSEINGESNKKTKNTLTCKSNICTECRNTYITVVSGLKDAPPFIKIINNRLHKSEHDSLTDSLPHSLTHSLTDSLTHIHTLATTYLSILLDSSGKHNKIIPLRDLIYNVSINTTNQHMLALHRTVCKIGSTHYC